MKRIYHERKREGLTEPFKEVTVWYRYSIDETIPPLVNLIQGHYEGSRAVGGDLPDKIDWILMPAKDGFGYISEAEAIRYGIKLFDEIKLEVKNDSLRSV